MRQRPIQSGFAIALCHCLVGFRSSHRRGRRFPGAILVAVAVGRFANNRSPPTSRWAHPATIAFDSPGPRLWWGQRRRAIGGRGAKCEREPLELFFESRVGASAVLTFMRHHSLWREDSAAAGEAVGRRWSTVLDKSTCARRWW